MTVTKRQDILEGNSLFSPEEQGISVSEFEKIQLELRNKLFLAGNTFFFPGNTPSLKSNKEIVEIPLKTSQCCNAPITRTGKGKNQKAFCVKCNQETRNKRPILTASNRVKGYQKSIEVYLLQNKVKFRNELKKYQKPYLLGFYFVRDSIRKFDYGNATEVLLDAFTYAGYYEDDNMDNVMNYPLGYHVDTNRPGAYVVILNTNFLREIIKFI